MRDPARRNEDEYFARESAELIGRRRAELDAARVTAPKPVPCPRDGAAMAERRHHGLAIDECPVCGGVFLDRGELELLGHVDEGRVGGLVGSLFGLKR